MTWVWITLALVILGLGIMIAGLVMAGLSFRRFNQDPSTRLPENRSYFRQMLAARNKR